MSEQKNNSLPKIVFVHIPRTGGTTFFRMMEEIYGYGKGCALRDFDNRSNIDFKHPGYGRVGYYPDCQFLYGHFRASKYKHLLDEGFNFVTWFRHPVDRMVSIYKNLRKKNLNGRSEIEHRLLVLNKLSFVEFAKLKRMRNQMWNITKGFDVDGFSFIGLTEIYDASLQKFSDLFNVELPKKVEKENVSELEYNPTPREIGLVSKLNYRDMSLYERIKKKWG